MPSTFTPRPSRRRLVALFSLAIIVVWPRFAISRKVPGPFVALIVATVLVQVMHLPVETIGSRFGAIAASFPHPRLPNLGALDLRQLVAPAFTIAMLGAVESLLSAVVADGMIGGRHRSNMELVAQGVANLVTPLFGGIPATGAIARTATNIKSGGRTPVAGHRARAHAAPHHAVLRPVGLAHPDGRRSRPSSWSWRTT